MSGAELAMVSLVVATLNCPWRPLMGFGRGRRRGTGQEGQLCGAVQTPVGRGAVGVCQPCHHLQQQTCFRNCLLPVCSTERGEIVSGSKSAAGLALLVCVCRNWHLAFAFHHTLKSKILMWMLDCHTCKHRGIAIHLTALQEACADVTYGVRDVLLGMYFRSSILLLVMLLV